MLVKNLQKGEVSFATLGLGMAAASFIIAPVVAYYSAQAATQRDISIVSERLRAVETFVPTIDKRLENIEKALKIGPSQSVFNETTP